MLVPRASTSPTSDNTHLQQSFVAFLRYGNDNLACGSCGGRLRYRSLRSPALRYTMEKMLISSFTLSKKLNFPRIPHEQAQTSIHALSKKLLFAEFCCRAVRGVKSVNGIRSKLQFLKIHAHKNLSRSLEYMVTDFRTLFD